MSLKDFADQIAKERAHEQYQAQTMGQYNPAGYGLANKAVDCIQPSLTKSLEQLEEKCSNDAAFYRWLRTAVQACPLSGQVETKIREILKFL